jgi:hypothetical protein
MHNATRRVVGASLLGLSFMFASTAQAARTPAVPATGADAREIVAATEAYLEHELGFPVTLRASIIRKNDRYAYIVARVSASSPLPAFLARDPALDAMLEKKQGRWTTMSYQSGSPTNGGGAKDMCGFGDGVHANIFRECH